jgi:hypothetical protein
MPTALVTGISIAISTQFTTIFVPFPPRFHAIHHAEIKQKIRRINESALHSTDCYV